MNSDNLQKNAVNPQSPTNAVGRGHMIVTIAMLAFALATALLAWFSFSHKVLYSPFGILASNNTVPNFYIGISIYITIATTLLTSALIRLALKLSK